MSFQIKDFRSIVASMINVARASQPKVTDFSVGSVARTLMESPAIEIEELYLQMLLGLLDAIPVAIYQAFDFTIIDARPAAGVLTLHFADPLTDAYTVPQGAQFTNASAALAFVSTASVTAPIGATSVDLLVVCTAAGSSGNIALDEITDAGSIALPSGVTFSNPTFVSGRDAESETERKTRFVAFIRSIARGTVDSIRYCAGAATVLDGNGLVQEYVTRIGVDEQSGRVRIYVCSSIGTPSPALLTKVQTSIDGYIDPLTGRKVDGYRPAGVSVTALPMAERAISIGLTVNTQYDAQKTPALRARIVDSVSQMILSVLPGIALRTEAITSAILSISEVMVCNLTNNVTEVCGQFERLTVGTVTVTWITNA